MTISKFIQLCAATTLSAGIVTLGLAAQTPKPKLPELTYETYTLPNGLKVLTHEDHRLPLVAIDLWYHVGPLNERPGRTGFAHLFEHMMFEGSEHVGEKAHFKYVEAAGATDVNGTTDFDRTNYFETLPANQLELGLWLESDRMGFLMEGLDRKLLQNQRDVVRNERRQGEGQPYSVADDATFHLLFPKAHPYYGNVMGSHADIEAARIADVRDFHQQFYTPNNATIAIAGDFKPAELRAMLTKYFGPIPQGPKVEPVNVVTPPITAQRRTTVTDTVQLSRLDISWLTPPAFTPESYSLDAAIYALGEDKASRLQQVLVYKSQVAQSVTCSINTLKLTSIAQCAITAKPGVKLEDLEKTFWAEVARLQSEGPTPGEVEAAKARDLTSKITGLQRLGGFGGVADTLDTYDQYTGDPGYLPKDVAAEEAVTTASAKAAAAKYLSPTAAVVVSTVPGKKVLDDVPRSPDDTDANVTITNPYSPEFEKSQDFRKTAPKPGPPVTVHLPVPQSFTLANGLKVYVVSQPSLPVLSAAMVSRAGSENNLPAQAGLATLTALIRGEATTSRSLTQLAQAQAQIGTSIASTAGMDSAFVSMTVLTQYTAPAMDLFSDVVEHPAFKPEDLERRRKTRLVAIQQETDSVGAMFGRVGARLLYGDQPYGNSPSGTTASVTALTRDDVTGFFAAHVGPADSALVLAGDVTVPQAKQLAERYFGAWTGTAPAAPVTLPPPPPAPSTHVVIVDKPGAPQTALIAYGLGVPANQPDLPALDVADYVLGSSFGSRINMNLREVHGYTYGAFSGFSEYRAGGTFLAGGLVRTDVTGPAAKELLGEIRRFPSNPPAGEELEKARDASIQSLPGQFETDGSIVASMASLFLYNFPLDHYAQLPGRFRAVTSADVKHVSETYIQPDHLIVVAVGDRSQIEPQLKAAAVGPVEVRDIDGKLVK